MRLAYVTETFPPEVNGVALTVLRTVRHLRERGHVVDLIRPRQPGDAADAASRTEWLTRGWPIPMYPDLRFGYASAGALRERYRQSRPDLVHIATPGPLGWEALRAARALNLPTSSDFRTNFHLYSRHYRLGALASVVLGALRWFHNRTERTFVPTRAGARELEAAGFRHLAVVGRGVDSARFDPARRSADWRAAGSGRRCTGAALCRPRRRREEHRPRAARLRCAAPAPAVGAHGRVGDGPLRESLELEHPEVRFVGSQQGDALAACYASADLFIFPSLTETFGNVTLEALASGLPVVAFDTAAAGEHVEHGRSGLLVAPGDEPGFVAAVGTLAGHPERLKAMGRCAVAAARRVRWDDVLGRFEAQLQDTIHGHQARPAADPVVA
jgi:glycosyltransferase involved in cell wall biosynthesis